MAKLAVVVVVFFFATSAWADGCELTGAPDTDDNVNWDVPGNWSCGHMPVDGDDVVISGHNTGPSASVTLESLTISGGTLSSGFDIYVTLLDMSGSTTDLTAPVQVTGIGTCSGHQLGLAFYVAAGALVTVNVSVDSGTFENAGTTNFVGGAFNNFVNDATGVLNFQAGTIATYQTAAGAVVNKISDGVAKTQTFINAGTINVSGGVWEGMTPTAKYDQTQATAELHLDGGEFDFDGGITIAAGKLTGSGFIGPSVSVTGGTVDPGDADTTGVIDVAPPSDEPDEGAGFGLSGGTLQIDVEGTQSYDRIVVDGEWGGAGGALQLDNAASFGGSADAQFHVISAASGSGAFNTANYGASPVTPTYASSGVYVGGTQLPKAFQPGDFVLGQRGGFAHASSLGTVLDYFPSDGGGTLYGGASCFDSAGNLYLPRPGANGLAKYDNTATLVNQSFYAGSASPDLPVTCLVTRKDVVLVVASTGVVMQLDASGAVTKTSAAIPNLSAAATLLADDCTLVYANGTVQAYNLCTDTAVSTYASFAQTGCGWVTAAPNGEVFAACATGGASDGVYRIDAGGTSTQTYLASTLGFGTFSTLTNLAIDPSGTSFWLGVSQAASSGPSPLVKVAIDAGTVLTQLHMPSTASGSMIIYGAAASGTSSTGGGTSGSSSGTNGGSSTGVTTVGTTSGGSTTAGGASGSTTGTTSGAATTTTKKKGGCNSSGADSPFIAFAVALLLSRRHRSRI